MGRTEPIDPQVAEASAHDTLAALRALEDRSRALIELLYATGLRVSEMVNLRQQDLNLESGFLTCTGKGRKQRLVPVGDEAAAWLTRYLREARPVLLKKRASARLFVNARGGTALSRVGLWPEELFVQRVREHRFALILITWPHNSPHLTPKVMQVAQRG